MGLLVHHPGTHSLLVDLGRPHTRSLGVPLGGAADRTAYLLGNALLGNAPEAVALEMTLFGPRLEATDTHTGVLSGAEFTVVVNQDKPISPGKTFTIRPGDQLAFTPPRRGLRAYLSVVGGFVAPELLGSRSAWQPLARGHRLDCPTSHQRGRFVRWDAPAPAEPVVLRVLHGSHAAQVGAEALVTQEYRVLPSSNRMGLRLQGSQPLQRLQAELLSAPVCPGTVQVTHDGQPVVLGVDAQTIGGYPRAAHVIVADLDQLGQLRPGDAVRFAWVDLPTAEAAWQEHRAWLREWQTRLAVVMDSRF